MMTRALAAAPPRVLGFWAAVSIVMGNMIGSGVFLLPASLAAYRGLSLVGWLVSAAGAVMLALVFARLSSQFPAAGGLTQSVDVTRPKRDCSRTRSVYTEVVAPGFPPASGIGKMAVSG